jgi:Uma2 family endonuclease
MRGQFLVPASAPLLTADEFARIPDDDYRYELVEGRLVRMSPPGSRHAAVAARLCAMLAPHAQTHNLGVVFGPGGFKLASSPDTVREPDVAFVRRERIPRTGVPEGFWPGPPDLAVEIQSPGDRAREIESKIDQYLQCGVRLVWVVDPDARTLTTYRRGSAPVTLRDRDTLAGGDVLPDFGCSVAALFD